jgi:hypothetical protein
MVQEDGAAMRIPHIHRPAIVLCILSFTSPAFAQLALPSNFDVPTMYRELVESMADRSPTFRGQLQRIAAAPGLTIDLEVVPHIVGARAATRMVRQIDGLDARIQVARFDNVVELIAHEIEHVIEQIEGVDLAAGAGLPDAEIYSVNASRMSFETARAARAGLSVAQEVRDALQREE